MTHIAFLPIRPAAETCGLSLPRSAAHAFRRLAPARLVGTLVVVLLAGGCARQQASIAARSEKAERLSVEARQAKDRGDAESAVSLLTAAVERNPSDYETRLELAELLLSHHDTQAAARHLRTLLEQGNDDPRVLVGMAEAQLQQRQLDKAEHLVAQALDLDPRHPKALLLQARIEQKRGHPNRALDDLYQVLECETDHADALLLIARLHLAQGDGRLAAPLLRTLIDSPSHGSEQRAKAQWLLGRCYSQDGRWSDAAVALAAGISSRPGSPRDWCLLAEACRRGGDLPGADQAVAQALALSPADSQALALQAEFNASAAVDPAAPAEALARTAPGDDEGSPPFGAVSR